MPESNNLLGARIDQVHLVEVGDEPHRLSDASRGFCAGILFLAGLQTFEVLWQAFIPVGVYFVIHLIEGEIVTPMLLARRFTLNPVLVIVALVFWYWMWGVAGAILAVPMLATVKIISDRVTPLMALGHFLGGDVRGKEID